MLYVIRIEVECCGSVMASMFQEILWFAHDVKVFASRDLVCLLSDPVPRVAWVLLLDQIGNNHRSGSNQRMHYSRITILKQQ